MKDSNIWINGGFFVMRNEIFRYIQAGRGTGPRAIPAADSEGKVWWHQYTGFWQCMDTFKDKQRLEELNRARLHGRCGRTVIRRQELCA